MEINLERIKTNDKFPGGKKSDLVDSGLGKTYVYLMNSL